MITVYRHPLSGHCHRVELFLSLIGRACTLVDVDLAGGAQKAPDFLARNPFGAVPVIDDDGVAIADSNAILVYLALKYADEAWYPRDPDGAAAVQRWLSVAAGEVARGPAAARLIAVFGAKLDPDQARMFAARLFSVMEPYLAQRSFLVGGGPTIADIACYSYIAHAPEGGVSLDPFPNIRAWLARIEALPGFVAMRASPVAAG
ncbi:MAG: glutathione S-transferase [Rhodospirillaceae bacterium]|nr:glutathione S-transferase [Rhodospirillaceae bacterium]